MLFLIMVLSFDSFSAQKSISIKRKWQGQYLAITPPYSLNTGNELVDVSGDSICIQISKTNFSMRFGPFSYLGQYVLIEKTKSLMKISGLVEGRILNEFFIIDRKNKTIIRKGISPQPDLILDKLGKKQGN